MVLRDDFIGDALDKVRDYYQLLPRKDANLTTWVPENNNYAKEYA